MHGMKAPHHLRDIDYIDHPGHSKQMKRKTVRTASLVLLLSVAHRQSQIAPSLTLCFHHCSVEPTESHGRIKIISGSAKNSSKGPKSKDDELKGSSIFGDPFS